MLVQSLRSLEKHFKALSLTHAVANFARSCCSVTHEAVGAFPFEMKLLFLFPIDGYLNDAESIDRFLRKSATRIEQKPVNL